MGTRSLTIVKDGDLNAKDIAVLYRQYDGYPNGHGKELWEAFKHHKICNGYSAQTSKDYANGMGCLFAQIVAHFKDGIGNIYLVPAGSKNMWEEYVYTVYKDSMGSLNLKVQEVHFSNEKRNLTTIYNDLLYLFGDFLKTLEETE